MHTLSLVSATITLSSATGYFVATLLVSAIVVHGEAFQPEFTEPITNLTVPVGRDAVFRCLVQHLGGYRVGWVKVDTKAIQAIHHNLITHNPRVSISHSNHVVWNLHIRGVQEEDGGVYMCQINTDPMLSQTGTLKVVVSPDFVFDETSGDILVGEGASTFLTCKATGRPSPRIEWRREDGKEVILRNGTSRVRVPSIDGPIFNMSKISRSEMGSYFCIAANGVPPAVSKRITVSVTFSPVIQVPNQLVGAPAGTDVTVECIIESFPKSINYWLGTAGEMLLTDNKHDVLEIVLSPYELQMSLTVKNFQRRDVGTYACMAKNSFGGVESSIRLYEIPGPTGPYHFNFDEEDYNEQYGSAENERDVQLSNRVAERGRRPSLQLTLGSARSTRHTYSSNHVPLNRASTCTTISISITSVTVFSLFVFILFTM
ncbi:hypothetical protein RN001_016312 [Aquatica leii]|uniref:Ig-like domain-containing protein n=1 Tax=Aquatica leii TaxID=1421715 RepID=A0AAN7SKD9_9COLE|nr:hypothetical protein RN001_016312 [Aquatica leii]